jgi:uncharacterized membrane protein
MSCGNFHTVIFCPFLEQQTPKGEIRISMDNMSGGKSALGLDVNVASLLAYIPFCLVGLIVSIIILVTDKTNKVARFHAFQSILIHAVFVVLYIVVMVVAGMGAAMNSTMLGLLTMLLYVGWIVGLLGLCIFAMVKAYGGNIFKYPVIGDMADKWSN